MIGVEVARQAMEEVKALQATERANLFTSPTLRNLELTEETIQKMDIKTFVKFRGVIRGRRTDDPLFAMIRQFPRETTPAGKHDVIVSLSKDAFETFRSGEQLHGDAICAAIACHDKPLPSGVLVVDPKVLEDKDPKKVPSTIKTLIFPIMAKGSYQWDLLVVMIFTKPIDGITAGIKAYHSRNSRADLHSNVNTVREYIKKAVPGDYPLYARQEIKCANHEREWDSGIAVISNALAVIHGVTWDKDMGLATCRVRREHYARKCLESALSNVKAFERTEKIKAVMNASAEQR